MFIFCSLPGIEKLSLTGTTEEEALKNIQEAIQLHLEVANEKARRLAMLYSNSTLAEMAV